MPEVPWFAEAPNAKLFTGSWGDHPVVHGTLHFIAPDGKKAVVHVTLGPTTKVDFADDRGTVNVWHIDLPAGGLGIATVSPSIHYVDFWHSPNPVRFNLVEDLNA